MVVKVKNFRFADKTVYIGNTGVKFDSEGVGEVHDEDILDGLLELPDFHYTTEKYKGSKDEEPKAPVEDEDEDEEPIEPVEDEEPTSDTKELVNEEDYTVKELDAKADELGIEISGNKKEKVKAINDFITANA